MSSLPSPSPAVKPSRPRKPLSPVAVTGRLITGLGTGLADLFNEAAVLTISGPAGEKLYWLGAITDAGRIVGLQLRKFVTGEVYRVALDGDSWECDCPDCTFRQRTCKHVVALHDALARPAPDDDGVDLGAITGMRPLDRIERDELTSGDHTQANASER